MSTRERILTIRLSEKISRDPAWAKALGIEVRQGSFKPGNAEAADRMEE